ncbi:hypothetical protein V2A60_004303 [Cordyceps javanica]
MPQLLSLPWELLTAIVAHLGPSQTDFDNFEHEYRVDSSLYRLGQTCTTLRDICIPKLYEICSIKTGGSLLSSINILRTLAARPEIAKQVKRVILDDGFHLPASQGNEIVISTADARLSNTYLREKCNLNAVGLLRRLRSSENPGHILGGDISESLTCLALALVPNITSAIFSSHYASTERFRPGSFPHLEAFSLQHADTELGTTFQYVEGVLGAAPNIRRLIGWSISHLTSFAYPSIRQVVLGHSRIDDEAMALLPVAFPKLEQFTYVDGGATVSDCRPASPLAISEALLGLRRTLKHVELGSHEPMSDSLDYLEAADRFMKSLARMEVLESLRLHALCIYEDEHDIDQLVPKTELVHFLPKSIQTLYIEGVQSTSLLDILALAQCAPQQFPKLTHVTFPALEKSSEGAVCHMYGNAGINCSFEAVDVNEYGCSCA